MGASVFSPLAARVAAATHEVVPLHVGDTWLEPFVGGRMQDLRVEDHPGLHRYGPTAGLPELVDAIVEKVRRSNGLDADRDRVLVTGGATGALACAVAALADPGEEVLILAPFWPLIRGIVRTGRAVPVEVPFFDRVDSAEDALAAVEALRTERTVALYVSTPSNPTGRVIPTPWLEALAGWARAHDLWVLSDEVYESFVYRGEHVSMARFAPERTASVFSFSKAYGMAGSRVGYLVGPAPLVAECHKAGVHTFYHAPTAAQVAAREALRDGAEWLARVRDAYRVAGEDAAAVLGVPAPEGSCFLFLDVREHLVGGDLMPLLEGCLEDGLLLAPGASSGAGYEGYARLCFTSAPPEQVAQAVRKLARRLGR